MEDILKKLNINYEIIDHLQSGKTTKDAKEALNIPSKNILKSLLFKSKKGNYLGVIIRGDKKADVKSVENYSYEKYGDNRFKKLTMASDDEVKSLLGYEIGGVPPVAFYNICEVICDKSILDVEFIVGAGGSQYKGLKLNTSDLPKLYNEWQNITF